MRVSFYFERSCPEQQLPRAALKPQEPRSSGPWTPGAPAPAEVLASRGVVVVESWQGKWQAAGAIFALCSREGGPPLRPFSHNVNPRDGVQDITRGEGTEGPHADATAGGAQQLEAQSEVIRLRPVSRTSS
jgi:hypothetical protein